MGQLFYRNLHLEFFERFPKNTTDFLAVSGYLGPDPLTKLETLPFNSRVMYGLQRETPNLILHNQLKKIHGKKVSIYYTNIPSHAKCYLWMCNDRPVRGLVGSANFSTNGLFNDFRETLIEVEKPDLYAVKAYIDVIQESAIACIDASEVRIQATQSTVAEEEGCEMVLYNPETGQVQNSSGLNWGFADAKVTPNDAYIPIRTKHIKDFPSLFLPVFFKPEDGHRSRSKEAVELIWDDGVIMEALFEGSQPVNGMNYPKQISSIPSKAMLGEYLRFRLGLPPVSNEKRNDERVTRADLERYGRSSINLKLLQQGIYSADFAPR